MSENESRIFGIRSAIEAIDADKSIEKLFVNKETKGPLMQELLSKANAKQISISYVPIEKLNRLTKNQNHQGVVANISPVSYSSLEEVIENIQKSEETPLLVILDQVSDVRNFGAIIRTAECAGVHAIIVPKNGSAPINSETVKTSAGAAFHIPICKTEHIKDALFELMAHDIQIVAATEKTEKNLYEVDLKVPTAIVMGAEDKGIHPSILKMVNEKVKLPMQGKIASLNVSVACGAFIYEAIRQRIL